MTLENTVEFYASNKTPDEIEIDGQTLIPIRTIMRLYAPSFGRVAQYSYCTENIKAICRRLKIPVIKPNGVYNIPCINKKFLDGILYLFRDNHCRYGYLIDITTESINEILSDVQIILRIIEDEIGEQQSTNENNYEPICDHYL